LIDEYESWAKRTNQEVFQMQITISVGPLTIDAELNDTPSARKVSEALPIRASFSTWGDEIYFTIPVEEGLDSTAREEVDMGDLGYWPSGKAFCIFFGPTPVSPPNKIVPASAVNLIGRVQGDATRFRDVLDEKEVLIELR
jgi:hypothetical protein